VLPLDVFHIASVGLDVMLGAIAYGASQVVVVTAGREPEGYASALTAGAARCRPFSQSP
jgi:hypothetical protein